MSTVIGEPFIDHDRLMGAPPVADEHLDLDIQQTPYFARFLGACGLFGITVVHYLDLGDKLSATPVLGYLYVGLMAAASIIALVLLFAREHVYAWGIAIFLATATMLGYVISRATGLPGLTDYIGKWDDPLGEISLVVEGFVIIVGFCALAMKSED